MAWRSPTDINWSKGAGESVNYANEVSMGWFANMLIISVFLIVLFGAYKSTKDIVSAFAIAGFVDVIVGVVIFIGGWMTWVTFGICLGLAIVSAAVLLLSHKN